MTGFRAYPKAKYFDMVDIQSPVRGTGLYCLSGTTWQLLKGWIDFYGDWRSRYVESLDVPIYNLREVDDNNWQIVQDALDLAQHEIGDDMSCDIVSAINNLTLAIQGQSGCCGETYGDTQNPPGTIDGTETSPPAGFVDPVVAVDTHRCDMSNLFWHGIDDILTELIQVGFENQFALGMTVITLTFTTVLTTTSPFFAAFTEYIGFVANLVLSLWNGEFSLNVIQTAWRNNKENIICTLYRNGSTDSRKIAYDALIDTFSLSDAEALMLKSFATLSTLASQFYAPEELASQWSELVGALDSTYQDCLGCVTESPEWVFKDDASYNGSGNISEIDTSWVLLSSGQTGGAGEHRVRIERIGVFTNPIGEFVDGPCENYPVPSASARRVVVGSVSGVDVGLCEPGTGTIKFKTNPSYTAEYDAVYTIYWYAASPFQVWATTNPGLFDSPPDV